MTAQQPGVEPIGEEALAQIQESAKRCVDMGYGIYPMTPDDVFALIARIRAAEADKRVLIAALRVNAMRLPTYPGHEAFDLAVQQMLSPGQTPPPPDDARARGIAEGEP